MRKTFKANNYLYPQPVLVITSYDKDKNPDIMTAAWGGITDYNQISIALSNHQTTENIINNRYFSVSIGTVDTVVSCDYVGLVSLKDDKEKINKSGFTIIESENNIPLIKELPLALECEAIEYSNEVLKAKIINVTCDESILSNGEIDPSKLNAIVYDPINHTYLSLGNVIGYAFKAGFKRQ